MTSLISLDWNKLPLGKLPFESDSRDLKLANYIDKDKLISSNDCPLAHDWDAIPTVDESGKLPEPDTDPLFNNVAGCCVFSGPGHMAKMVGQQTGEPIVVTAEMVSNAYSAYTGYKLNPKLLDRGFSIRIMLKIWKLLGLYGTKALAYAIVNWNDPTELALASWLGCGTLGGFALPKASQSQLDAQGRQLWSVPQGGFPEGQGPGTWGNHCIWCHAPSPGLEGGNSWGIKTYWTTEWNRECCDERWMALLDKWKMRTGRAPNGFAFDDLLADAAARSA